MRNIDRKFVMATVLTTVIAILGYMFLSWQAHNYANNIEPTAMGGITQAPFIVIGVFHQYWWFAYGVAMLGLFLRWMIKRMVG